MREIFFVKAGSSGARPPEAAGLATAGAAELIAAELTVSIGARVGGAGMCCGAGAALCCVPSC